MNCFELRHRKLIAPRELNAEAEAHQRECLACAAFVERLGAFEESLQTELQVPVPDGLAERVLLHMQRHVAGRQHWRAAAADRLRALAGKIGCAAGGLTHLPWGWSTGFAFAATLVLGLGIASFYALTLEQHGLAIAEVAHDAHVMQEMLDEPAVQSTSDPAALPRLLAVSGVRLPSDFRDIRYVGPCGPPDRTGEHIVMQTQFGKASLVLMPRESASVQVVQFDDGMVAAVKPARVGSLAVVADSKQAAVHIADML
jgi:hypothetical protein